MAQTFRDLIVWRKAISLCKTTYLLTQQLPATERYGLVSQMRRAVVSVPSNIAEGNARETIRDYLRFLVLARASLAELETQLIICQELGLLQKASVREPLLELQEVRRILLGLISSLRGKL